MMHHLSAEQILAFRDGESADPDVARHVDACKRCRRELQSARRFADLLKTGKSPALMSNVDAFTPPPVSVEHIRQSQPLGLLIARHDIANVYFEFSALPIDHSFLGHPPPLPSTDWAGYSAGHDHRLAAEIAAHSAVLERRTLRRRSPPPVDIQPFSFQAGEFRIAVNAEDLTGSRLRIEIRSDHASLPCAGLELTLLDSENPPTILSLNEEGVVQLELRSARSILLFHTEPISHLGIELSN